MKKRKISFFLPNLAGGGAERVILNIAEEFSRRGLDVDLVLIKKEGPYTKNFSGTLRIVDLNCTRAAFSLFPLVSYIKKEKPAFFLSTLIYTNIIAVLAKMVACCDFKLVLRISGFPSYKSLRIRSRVIKFIAEMLYARADCIIAISKEMYDDLIQKLRLKPETIRLIYNPINIAFIREQMVAPNYIKCFSAARRYPIILGAGRLTRQKGFDCLIRAFSLIRRKRGAKMVILGEGIKRRELEELIYELGLKDDIHLPGFVDNPYVYMKNSDVFVLSSISEGLSNVLLEALACGTPVVSTDCQSGPSEILCGGEYGRLVPVGHVEAMAKAIDETLDNPHPPEFLRDRAEDFDLKKIADEYLEVMSVNTAGKT